MCALAWLATACVAGPVASAAHASPGSRPAAWVVEPGVPGADLPPAGRSLFDHLTATRRDGVAMHDVPYPFSALLDRIALEIDPSGRPVKRVLIPLGRSLQRSAAAPDYFMFPRVVAAVDGEPAATSAFLLKDRLYLGYQPKANLIEVISYNEEAGRFEFQLVRNYGPESLPQVVYATRAICTSCHQNAGPIFPRQQWDETSANPEVAQRIRRAARDLHGTDLESGIDLPQAIDNATDRANRFAVSQLLWRDGCGGDADHARRCRSNLFAAVLRYRLSGRSPVDILSPQFHAGVLAPVTASARVRWPSGLAIADPDIPNRDPLASNVAPAALAHVEAAFDPLAPREPLEIWRADDADLAPRLVAGLAEFVSSADIARLDARLASRWSREASSRTTLTARCDVRRVSAAPPAQRLDFDCATPGVGTRSGMRVQARVEIARSRPPAVALTRLQLPDQPSLVDISASDASATVQGSGYVAVVTPRRGALHARTTNGDGIERLTLRWNGSGGEAVASIARDSAALDRAVEALSSESSAGRFEGFDARAFRGARLMPALLSALGAPAVHACCVDDGGLPPARIDAVAPAQVPAADDNELAALRAFYRYCSACHLTREASPPNFLAGDAAAVRGKLSQCSTRIYARLGMWQRPYDPHAKTPMPPALALARHELTADTWRASGDLAAMSSYAARLVETRTGRAPDHADVLARRYEELPSCLPGIGDRARAERSLKGSDESTH